RIGRANFPLPFGALPASMVVRLAPFSRDTLQHFIYLERPSCSSEPDGGGYTPPRDFTRGIGTAWHTPMGEDYATVGVFYESLKNKISQFVAEQGEAAAFCGDPALQISGSDYGLMHARRVICAKTALQAFDHIVAEGEGASDESTDSHFCRFISVRKGLDALEQADPGFVPAHPAATNPVLRVPPEPAGRVWLEDAQAVATVDLANAAYGLMLRALAYAFAVPDTDTRKASMLRLAIGLMRGMSPLGEAASRLPAGPSNPGCNAGVSFTTLRDSSALPPGAGADRLISERLREFAQGAADMAQLSPRHAQAAAQFASLAKTFAGGPVEAASSAAANGSGATPATAETAAAAAAAPAPQPPAMEIVPGKDIEIHYQGVRCIHSRFCVTGAPTVFLANVQGPWIHPDTMPVERLVDIAHACPSGAIAYRRLDGQPDEASPPVNLVSVREAGPLAVRGDITLAGQPAGKRLTLCRCGASSHKPYCDGSHHNVEFTASGEPKTTDNTAMLPVRDGPLRIDPERNGPLQFTGNLEMISGTGRMVTRVTATRLCRCGGSSNKPFCDGTHQRIGFQADGA
ncbi:MAG: CDGSH iron-sulfur domain-containing protein, partial [Steroidobacteraceae bacterium]